MSKSKLYGIFYAYFLIFLFFTYSSKVFSQVSDSVKIYKKLKEVSDKSRFTRFIYNSVFVEPGPAEYPSEPTSSEEKIVNPYLKHENKIIRKVSIIVMDPFGKSIADTIKKRTNILQRAGNGLHVSTRKKIIDNKLLFKVNDTLNPLSISESERLIRQSAFINDAKIVITGQVNSDSVEITVLVIDKWNITIPVVVTDVYAYARFQNQNLFGFGQQFEQYAKITRPDKMDYSGYYTISNIDHTYISSRLYYETNSDGTGAGLAFDRPFYSPLAEWAGGVSAYKAWKYFQYTDSVTGANKYLHLNSSTYDMWLGKSIRINSKKKFFNQSTNFIVGERAILHFFDNRPSFEIDKAKANQNSATFIGNIGFAVQQFYKEKFIYRFGATEDVPQGLIIQFLYGAAESELGATKYYLGGEIARAKHVTIGYFSANVSYGMFIGSQRNNDITTSLKINYFSDLFRMRKWYLREFVNYNFVYGINKMPYEKLTLSSEEMYGFNGGGIDGNSKMVVNLETVAYAPYNLVGFRFAPTLLTGIGMLSDENHPMNKSTVYQSYAIALMVRNENLLNSTFQVSFGMYPIQPDGQNNIFKYNPITSFTIRVRSFSIGRPEFITY